MKMTAIVMFLIIVLLIFGLVVATEKLDGSNNLSRHLVVYEFNSIMNIDTINAEYYTIESRKERIDKVRFYLDGHSFKTYGFTSTYSVTTLK